MVVKTIYCLLLFIFLIYDLSGVSAQSTCQSDLCEYGDWGSWTSCICHICEHSTTQQEYRRECIRRQAVLTKPDGCNCQSSVEFHCGEVCCNENCPTTAWSEWSTCPEQCDANAYKNRTRTKYPECDECDNLAEGVPCQPEGCCPVNCQLDTWGDWGECSVNCQSESGVKTRYRLYEQATCGGIECTSSDYTETKTCKGSDTCGSGTGGNNNNNGDTDDDKDEDNDDDGGEGVDGGDGGGDDGDDGEGHNDSLSTGCITGTWSNWGFCPSGDSQYRIRPTLSGVCGGECSVNDGIESREYPCEMRIFSKVTASVILSEVLQSNDPDISVILSELGPPTNLERQEIKSYYKVAYGSELVDELIESIPDYIGLDCLLLLLESAEYFSANVLIPAIQNHDERVISQVLIQKTNKEVNKINDAYTQLTGRTMDADLADVFQTNNERLLRSLAEGGRDETGSLDETLLDTDVHTLRDSVRKNAGNARLVQSVLSTRDFEHLQHVLAKFEEIYPRNFKYYLQRNIKGPVMHGFLNIVQVAEDPVLYCVVRIHDALYPSSGSVDENLLVNTVIDCARNDMCFVRDKYLTKYDVKLVDDIIVKYDGRCQDVLLAVVN